jgi:TonB family protein
MIALAFLVASFGAFKTPTASAQTKTCSLALNIATYKNDQIRPVTGARATALNTRTRKTTVAVALDGQLRFSKLADGEYRISVTKPGFKRAIQPVSFQCEVKDARAELQVELDPGNYKRSVVAGSQSVVASSEASMPPIRRGVTTILGSAEDSGARPASSLPMATPPSGSAPRAPISFGVLNGKALVLEKPIYPPIARQAHASGTVVIQVVIDEEGNIISARAVSGHPLLQAVCVDAARKSKFSGTTLAGQPVKVTGVITYNFVAE